MNRREFAKHKQGSGLGWSGIYRSNAHHWWKCWKRIQIIRDPKGRRIIWSLKVKLKVCICSIIWICSSELFQIRSPPFATSFQPHVKSTAWQHARNSPNRSKPTTRPVGVTKAASRWTFLGSKESGNPVSNTAFHWSCLVDVTSQRKARLV